MLSNPGDLVNLAIVIGAIIACLAWTAKCKAWEREEDEGGY